MSPPSTTIHLGYFYLPKSTPEKGWRDRRTVAVDERGRVISRTEYDDLQAEGWVCLGHWELGTQPKNVWEPARVQPT